MAHQRTHAALACAVALTSAMNATNALAQVPGEASRPNVILIYVDDLGIGDISPYGQLDIPTPRIQQLANEGMTFTQHYAGSPVCAPSRAAIQLGLHAGHVPVRDFGQVIRPKDKTLGEKAKEAGYVTGLVGKWGLGGNENVVSGPGCSGGLVDHDTYAFVEGCNCDEWYALPFHQGYDYFMGFLNHRSAHDFYPEQVWQSDPNGFSYGSCLNGSNTTCSLFNAWPYPLPGNVTIGTNPENRGQYIQEEFTSWAESFIDTHASGTDPFFLMINWTIPHRELEVPALAPFTGLFPFNTYPLHEQIFATMVNTLDTDVGRILDRLDTNGIRNNTAVIFTSDNGAQAASASDEVLCAGLAVNHDEEQYNSNSSDRGRKFDLFEGGIRVPMIVRWPDYVPGATVTSHLSAQYDVMATFCDMLGLLDPIGIDGLSFLPTIVGSAGAQRQHPYLYFEYNSVFRGASTVGNPRVAVRWNGQKYIRYDTQVNVPPTSGADTAGVELFNLAIDPSETTDLSSIDFAAVSTMEAFIADEYLGPPSDPFARARYPLPTTTAASDVFSNASSWWNGIVPGRYGITDILNESPYERIYWMDISHEVLALRLKSNTGFKMRMPFFSGVTLTADNGVRIAPGGQMELNAASVITQSKFEITANGVFGGAGSIVGNVFNNGIFDVVRFWGTMNITGDFVNQPGGLISHDIAGTTPGLNQYDFMDVSGTMVAGGQLHVVTSYTPSLGDDVKIIEAQSLAGRFASISSVHTSTRSWAVRPIGTDLFARYTKLGDVNLDNQINQIDINIVNANNGLSNVWWTDGDVNGDNAVNATDLAIVTANQGL